MSANEIIFLLSCLALIGVYISIQKFIKVRSSKRDYRINAGKMNKREDKNKGVTADHLVAKKKNEQLSNVDKYKKT